METQILKHISKIAHMSRTIRGARQRFANDESGTMIIFALILFVLMAMMGGIAVDLMRYETTRTTLQNTLDRSTLAAASLSQSLVPETVVRDYFEKAGMTSYLKAVIVDEGLNYREVNATALADTKPFFLHMIGIDKFEAPGASTAEQRISNVEVMLVLDVSGSMAGTKLTNLKSAASEFVDTVLSSDGDDRISIGLVPYNGQVNLGTTMASKFQVTVPTGVANTSCVDLPSSVYTGTSISRTLDLPTTAYADTFSTTSTGSTSYVSPTNTSSATPASGNRWCPPSTVNIVRPPINNIVTLQGYINNMTAIGATSINAGLKWGLTLLDPASRPIFAELASSGVIPSTFNVRPFEYTDDEALKVIVLMTDGEHFAEERVNLPYKAGLSPIYKASDGNYSIRHTTGRPTAAGTKEYFVPHLCTSSNCTSGSDTSSAWSATKYSNGVQQTWVQVWADMRVSYVAWQMYARALGTSSTTRTNTYNTWMSNFRTLTPTTTMDSQLQAVCTLAKSKKNIVVYGIAFDAPAAGAQQIKMCTSGYDPMAPNDANPYYFASTPTSIKTAFRAIATNISQLRLTQ
jgi:Putative Flp pilus-assembly TadE/G-like